MKKKIFNRHFLITIIIFFIILGITLFIIFFMKNKPIELKLLKEEKITKNIWK